jgi:RNA polymerase sigma factor (sigma-70 family)
MNSEALEPLLEKLCQGDMTVAKTFFVACEPFLRRLVRERMPARLQAKFDSADVVQSVWADLLDGYRAGAWHFEDFQRFRAFLVQVTRNRFNDKFRKHRAAFEKEQELGGLHTSEMPMAGSPKASEVAQAEELWRQLLQTCAPEHRELLRLKRQGLAMDKLTQHTGLHPGSIRRILRNLARKMALS